MIVADTGPLVALGDKRSKLHERCVELLRTTERPWLIPAPVVIEVCQLLASRVHADAEAAFLRSLVGKTFRVIDLMRKTTSAQPNWSRSIQTFRSVESTLLLLLLPNDSGSPLL